MSAEFGLYYPPWSYTGPHDELLARAAGEVGLDHLTIPVVTGELSQFRLGRLDEGPYFHTEGGWHFPPRAELYGGSVRPPTAGWFGRRDVPARLCERAAALGLAVLFRADLTAVRRLARQPHLCRQNAWGQQLSGAPPCVCNPELRELLRATLEDLTRYGPAGFELEGWARGSYAGRAAALPRGLPGALLRICFCASCRQIAARRGVDPEQAARSVRVHARALPDAKAPLASDPVLRRYRQARAREDRRWLERLAESHRQRRCLRLDGWSARPARLGPGGWQAMGRPRARLVGAGLESVLPDYLRALGAKAVSLRAYLPSIDEAARLVKVVSAAAAVGVRFFDFEGLDEAPAEAVTWLKQAVRYARRG